MFKVYFIKYYEKSYYIMNSSNKINFTMQFFNDNIAQGELCRIKYM